MIVTRCQLSGLHDENNQYILCSPAVVKRMQFPISGQTDSIFDVTNA